MKNKSFGQVMALAVKSFENGKILSLKDPAGWGRWLGYHNFTGQSVTVNSALQISTVWAIVNLLSGTMATLPLFLNVVGRDGSKKLAKDHPLYNLLKNRPNADMTAVIFWKIFYLSMLLWGAAYCEIKRTGGRVTSINFLWPEAVTVRRLASGAVQWKYTDPVTGRPRDLSESQMWFTPAYTLDGITPISPIRMGCNVIGGAMAGDRAAAETFTSGMKSPGLVTMSESLLQPKQREDIREHVATVTKSGGFLVLEKGAGFQRLSMNPQDAQLLETRSYSVEELCGWWGVNPTMIGRGSDKNSNWGTGLTQQKQGFVDFTLRQWSVLVEASIRENLLTPVERLTYSAEWVFEGLLRGNPSERAGFYSTMTQNGIMTRDEARGLENLPLAGGNAEELTVQSNLLPIDKLGSGTDNATNAQDALKSWLGLEATNAP